MPRVSAAHEQEVRDRILDAASRVFAEKGYHSSTIADVVRESGLSVGAIYTYFSGKDELIRLTCDQLAARGPRRARRAAGTGHDHRRAAGDRRSASTSRRSTSTTAPRARSPWSRRGPRPTANPGSARCWRVGANGSSVPASSCFGQGVISGELPAWLDVDAVTRALPGAARRADAPADRGRRCLPAGRPRASRDGASSSCCSARDAGDGAASLPRRSIATA